MDLNQVQELRQQMAATGWAPVPLITGDKAVKIPRWSELAREKPSYFAELPPRPDMANTGFLCDRLRVVDIDIDDLEYVQHVLRLALKHLGDRPLVRSRSNSVRLALVYRAAEGAPVKVVVSGKHGKVEILGRGQQLHAFGLHPSGVAPEWHPASPGEATVEDLQVVADSQVEMFLRAVAELLEVEAPVLPNSVPAPAPPTNVVPLPSRTLHLGHTPEIDREALRDALMAIPNDARFDSWEAWNRVGMALWSATGGSGEGFSLFDQWSSRHATYDARKTRERWDSITRSPPKDLHAGTIFWMARYEHGWQPRVQMPAQPPALDYDPETGEIKPGPQAGGQSVDNGGYVASAPDYITDGRGFPVANAHNVVEFLTHDDEFAGILATDTFANKRVLLRQLPNIRGPRQLTKPLVLTETHIAAILARVQRRLIPKATKAMVCDALDVVFPRTTMHPVRAYLEGLKWDGTARISTWLQAYLGATGDEDEMRYVSAVGRAWLVAAVARVMRPGCKADAALILEGQQGIGKSSTAQVLAGEWFGDALPHLGTKDAASYLQGLWIIELAELANMAKAEVEVVKSFMSRTEDRFRPAYARLEVSVPRQCVFIGSTNADNYLRDTTGNRRFWPVRCGKIELARLADDRDQLWAEAVQAFNAGEKWWLADEVIQLAMQQQQQRVDTDDPLTGRVMEIAAGKERYGVCVAQIAQDLFPEKRDQTEAMARRLGKILRGEGWVQRGFTAPSSPWGKQKRFVKEVA